VPFALKTIRENNSQHCGLCLIADAKLNRAKLKIEEEKRRNYNENLHKISSLIINYLY
jgi:hypothetical protein